MNTSDIRMESSVLLLILVMAATYFLTGWGSLVLANHSEVITILFFAAEGFSLAAVLIYGFRVVPGIFLGQFLLILAQNWSLTAALGVAVINSLEAILASVLFQKLNLDRRLGNLRDVLGLLLLITLVLQPFSAVTSNLFLAAVGSLSWKGWWLTAFSWWFGNVMGQLLFTPMLLLLYARRHLIRFPGLIVTGLLFGAASYYLQVHGGIANHYLLLMLTLLPVVLLSVYRGTLYGVFATTVIAVVSEYAASYEHSVLVSGQTLDQLVNLNFYVLAHLLLALILGTLFEERYRMLGTLRKMAYFDALTGLPNRNFLEKEVGRVIRYSRKGRGLQAVCFLDVNGFKEVNDTLGHQVGDRVLVSLARRIEEFLGANDVLLRLSGDEFLLVLNDLKDKEELSSLLLQILERANEPIFALVHQVRVSLSIGVALVPEDGDTVTGLLHVADQAMYRAKEQGGGFVFHRPSQEQPGHGGTGQGHADHVGETEVSGDQ